MSLTATAFTSIMRLTTSEFNQLVKLVYDQCGINLTPAKKVMLESRLAKRLRVLNMGSFREYLEFLTSKEGIEQELIHMIDVVTTNKTDFFREPHHFDFMRSTVLPQFHEKHDGKRTLKVWSSACSTGEEPYTLAMVLQDYRNLNASFNYSIVASDISTQVLERASMAIYNGSTVIALPLSIKQRYLLKNKNKDNTTVRVVPTLRDKVNFLRLNLMDNHWGIEEQDIIFCRNVLIYFDRKTQLQVVSKLIQKLRPGGLLFIGHSESLHGFDLPVKQIKPTIFIKN